MTVDEWWGLFDNDPAQVAWWAYWDYGSTKHQALKAIAERYPDQPVGRLATAALAEPTSRARWHRGLEEILDLIDHDEYWALMAWSALRGDLP